MPVGRARVLTASRVIAPSRSGVCSMREHQIGIALYCALGTGCRSGAEFRRCLRVATIPVLMRTTLDHLSTAAAPGRCTCCWAAIAVCATVDRRGARPRPSGTRRRRWSTGADRGWPRRARRLARGGLAAST
jgi:hypothetical protein